MASTLTLGTAVQRKTIVAIVFPLVHLFPLVFLGGLFLSAAPTALASDLGDATELFRKGEYGKAEKIAREQVERGVWNERWPRLLIDVLVTQGKYAEAREVYTAAISRYPTSLTLRMQGLEVLRYSNLPDEASAANIQILTLLQSSPTRYASRDNLVAAGRYFAMRGEDARRILQLFYDRVRDADPEHLEAYLATAELALDKGDFKVAADTLQQALRFETDEPQLHYLLARAYKPSDRQKTVEAMTTALSINPKHLPSLLLQAELAIDSEQYEAARANIDQVLEINPKNQEALALSAVMAHLDGDFEREKELREQALATWSNNPRVDHLIGLKLSQKYRFAEGMKYQQQAIELDADHSDASFQLAQDLLRLGYDEIGWELAEGIAERDPYNVVAHNLITLYDRIKGFTILEANGIQVRMEPREAAIYGDEVLQLLDEARDVLCEKYDVEPTAPIVVEIFPNQNDFAIRTFGLPGGDGFLGVCFGRVITANSPASQIDTPANWKSVLWHEFCHVVTLEKTRNRMPRWLSEGISVYEERQRNPAWGEQISPVYREMLLSDSLTPVSELSAAFLSPPSPIHLQFAYYESSLVIEYLIEEHGAETLNQILVDLGDGLLIDDALAKNVGSVERLDVEFARYAKQRGEAFAPEAIWSKDDLGEDPTQTDLEAILNDQPNHLAALQRLSAMYLTQKDYASAKPLLERMVSLGAVTGTAGGPLEMLASVHRELDELESEREVLQRIVAMTSDSIGSLRRLMELAGEQQDWEAVLNYAQQFNAINPLLPEGHRATAAAAEQLEQPQLAVDALRALSQMDPIDPAGLDYRLAVALKDAGKVEQARHHVLQALAEAPRYRDAHRLLLQLIDEEDELKSSDADSSDADLSEAESNEAETNEAESSDTDAKETATEETELDEREPDEPDESETVVTETQLP